MNVKNFVLGSLVVTNLMNSGRCEVRNADKPKNDFDFFVESSNEALICEKFNTYKDACDRLNNLKKDNNISSSSISLVKEEENITKEQEFDLSLDYSGTCSFNGTKEEIDLNINNFFKDLKLKYSLYFDIDIDYDVMYKVNYIDEGKVTNEKHEFSSEDEALLYINSLKEKGLYVNYILKSNANIDNKESLDCVYYTDTAHGLLFDKDQAQVYLVAHSKVREDLLCDGYALVDVSLKPVKRWDTTTYDVVYKYVKTNNLNTKYTLDISYTSYENILNYEATVNYNVNRKLKDNKEINKYDNLDLTNEEKIILDTETESLDIDNIKDTSIINKEEYGITDSQTISEHKEYNGSYEEVKKFINDYELELSNKYSSTKEIIYSINYDYSINKIYDLSKTINIKNKEYDSKEEINEYIDYLIDNKYKVEYNIDEKTYEDKTTSYEYKFYTDTAHGLLFDIDQAQAYASFHTPALALDGYTIESIDFVPVERWDTTTYNIVYKLKKEVINTTYNTKYYLNLKANNEDNILGYNVIFNTDVSKDTYGLVNKKYASVAYENKEIVDKYVLAYNINLYDYYNKNICYFDKENNVIYSDEYFKKLERILQYDNLTEEEREQIMRLLEYNTNISNNLILKK